MPRKTVSSNPAPEKSKETSGYFSKKSVAKIFSGKDPQGLSRVQVLGNMLMKEYFGFTMVYRPGSGFRKITKGQESLPSGTDVFIFKGEIKKQMESDPELEKYVRQYDIL